MGALLWGVIFNETRLFFLGRIGNYLGGWPRSEEITFVESIYIRVDIEMTK